MKLPGQPLVLPRLPYDLNALEPVISAETMEVHYLGHHKTYIDKYNKLLAEGGTYEDKMFNFCGHILHSLYWGNLTPFPANPGKLLQEHLYQKYSSINLFMKKIVDASINLKGSGWVVVNQNLDILTIPNHDLTKLGNDVPILVIDGWEHSWYLDFKNNKSDFFNNFIHIINWDKVLDRFLKNIN